MIKIQKIFIKRNFICIYIYINWKSNFRGEATTPEYIVKFCYIPTPEYP